MVLVRLVLRPVGCLAFVIALAALSGAAWLLGDRHELGFFSRRLAKAIWRYPELTRRGIQIAWIAWATAFLAAASDTTPWDEAALAALALLVLFRRVTAGRRANL